MNRLGRVAVCSSLLVIPSGPTGAQLPVGTVSEKVTLAVSEFHAFWQTAWQISEDLRRAKADSVDIRNRRRYAHCHSEWFLEPMGVVATAERQGYGVIDPRDMMIKGSTTGLALCPTWLLSSGVADADGEERWRDGAIIPSLRQAVGGARNRLLTVLEDALTFDSVNPWLVGQIVRFRIDARDLDGAKEAARRCRSPAWWCDGLVGLVHDRRNEGLAADLAFTRMRAAMPDTLRCRWEDLRNLLRDADRASYTALDCKSRDSLNERIWWLADPLYRVAGNARLVEQQVRRMEIALRQLTLQDERFRFDHARGGDAVADALNQYGWPTYTAWLGTQEDRSHTGYLVSAHKTAPSPPYTTFEYALGRVQSIPAWAAIVSPFDATSDQWRLASEDSTGAPLSRWWPQEHFRPSRRLVQLADGQTVRLRRQEFVDVATAVPLIHPVVRSPDATFDVMLLSTSGPTSVDSVDRVVTKGGSIAFLRGRVPHGRTLLAVEAQGTGYTAIDARTRYAHVIPPPLSALASNEIALSDIALLSPLSNTQLEAANDSLLHYMLASRTMIGAARQVSLYWESYGTRPADSASYSIRVASEATISLLRRVAMMAGIAPDPTSVVEVRWKDHERPGGVTTLAGPVPVQMRTLTLDLSQLKPGRYMIEVGITLRDGRTATQSTTLWLVL